MSLDWSIENIENYKELCWGENDRMNPVTEALIWAGNSIGFNNITEKNYKELYIRINMWERGVHSFLQQSNAGVRVDTPLTLDNVRQHIGLSTNWSTMTNTQFGKHLIKSMRREAEREMGRSA